MKFNFSNEVLKAETVQNFPSIEIPIDFINENHEFLLNLSDENAYLL